MSGRRHINIADPRTARQLDRARELHAGWRADERAYARWRKDRPVPRRTPQQDLTLRELDTDRLNNDLDSLYTDAADALDAARAAGQRETTIADSRSATAERIRGGDER
jgi:hypothetical protein